MAARDALPSIPAPQAPTRLLPPAGETIRVQTTQTVRLSSHPTSRPDTDPASMAEASVDLRTPAFAFEECPISMQVPVRTGRSGSDHDAIGHREAFVLMHVDGITEVVTIANLVGLPVPDVLACFERLVKAGLVDLTIPQPALPGESGVFLTQK